MGSLDDITRDAVVVGCLAHWSVRWPFWVSYFMTQLGMPEDAQRLAEVRAVSHGVTNGMMGRARGVRRVVGYGRV